MLKFTAQALWMTKVRLERSCTSFDAPRPKSGLLRSDGTAIILRISSTEREIPRDERLCSVLSSAACSEEARTRAHTVDTVGSRTSCDRRCAPRPPVTPVKTTVSVLGVVRYSSLYALNEECFETSTNILEMLVTMLRSGAKLRISSCFLTNGMEYQH